MNDSVKITVIGAGSEQFARVLIHDMVLDTELTETRQIEVVFVDLNAAALARSLEYAKRCAALVSSPVKFRTTTDRAEALPGSDFVLLSVAVERLDLWEQDFRVPLAFGMKHVYGENGGPGAIFHALRNLRIIMPICADIERYCPDALLLNFTNPEARILKAILSLTKVNAVGLCHGFYSAHHAAVKILGRELSTMDVRTAGMNHLFTLYKLTDRETGEDLFPELRRRLEADPELIPPVARWLWQKFGVLGYTGDTHIGEYLRYAHEFCGLRWLFGLESRKVFRSEKPVTTRSVYNAWVYGVDPETYLKDPSVFEPLIETVDAQSITRSGELAVPIIADLILDRGRFREAVNVLNTEGYISNLDREACIEVPAMVDAKGIHPESIGALPEGFAAMIRLQHSIQHLLVEAYRESSRYLLLQALLLDPVVDSARQAEVMLDYMLELQADFLPEFT